MTASPLVFKLTKEVSESTEVELCNFNAAKYSQIRIAVKLPTNSDPKDFVFNQSAIDTASVELNAAKRTLESQKSLYEKGFVSKAEIERNEQEVFDAQSKYNEAVSRLRTKPQISRAGIFGFESGENFLLSSTNKSEMFVFDTPPSQIKIKVSGKGTYKVFIWASL